MEQVTVSHDTQLISEAIILNNQVFSQTHTSLYNDRDEWDKRIKNGGYFAVALENKQVIGFAVCDKTKDGDFKIWLAGVAQAARGKGIWSTLFKDVSQYASSQGYSYILLNTFPEKFPTMYAFLQKKKAIVYKKEQVDGFEKVYARIPL
jgi:GNAT superfamily N-acetyltransferase